LAENFEKKFGCKPEFFGRAPGRVNLIGKFYANSVVKYCTVLENFNLSNIVITLVAYRSYNKLIPEICIDHVVI
jgi:hypothetical protein